MKKSDKYIMWLVFAIMFISLTAFAYGFSAFCYKKGFADGIKFFVKPAISQYHK